LEKTVETLKGFGEPVTADQVAVASGRSRGIESGYLNVLFRSGVVGKRREGR
jgi:hypothetical protein